MDTSVQEYRGNVLEARTYRESREPSSDITNVRVRAINKIVPKRANARKKRPARPTQRFPAEGSANGYTHVPMPRLLVFVPPEY